MLHQSEVESHLSPDSLPPSHVLPACLSVCLSIYLLSVCLLSSVQYGHHHQDHIALSIPSIPEPPSRSVVPSSRRPVALSSLAWPLSARVKYVRLIFVYSSILSRWMIDGHLHHSSSSSSSGGGGGGGGDDHHSTSSLPSVKPPSHISHLTLECSPLYQLLTLFIPRRGTTQCSGVRRSRRRATATATATTATSVGISVPRPKWRRRR